MGAKKSTGKGRPARPHRHERQQAQARRSAGFPEFDRLWSDLFTTRVHLDSALSKRRGEEKSLLAQIVPFLLQRPKTIAAQLGIILPVGEPWNLSLPNIARWPAATRIAIKLRDQPEAIEAIRAGSNSATETLSDFPPGMIEELSWDWGEECALSVARELSKRPRLNLRLARRVDASTITDEIAAELGIRPQPGKVSPLGLRFDEYAPVLKTQAHARGEFEIQDEGSQVMALFALDPASIAPWLGAKPGQVHKKEVAPLPASPKNPLTVVDACSGAGGKALAIADLLGGRGRIYAYDISEMKLRGLRNRASRAGVRNIQAVAVPEEGAEETLKRFFGKADLVLVDAPCTGWGVLRRNPDIKWRQTADECVRLPELQLRLLSLYSRLVRPGGRLVYGACTFRKAETVDVTARFSAAHPEFVPNLGGFLGPGASDGFYMQAFERKGSP